MNQPLADTKASAQRTTALRFDIIAGLTAAAVVLAERLGRERMLFNARAAIERYQGDDDGKEKRSE
jgi:orotate phosphoribosyltransferase